MQNNQPKMTTDMKNPYLQKKIVFPILLLILGIFFHISLISKDIQISSLIFLPFYVFILGVICLNYNDIKNKVSSYQRYIEELEKNLKKAPLTIEEFLPKVSSYARNMKFNSSIKDGFKNIVATTEINGNEFTIFSLTKELATNCLVFGNGKLSLANGFKIDYAINRNNTLAIITPHSSLDILYLTILNEDYLFSYPIRDYRYNSSQIWSGETVIIFDKDDFLDKTKHHVSKFLIQEL